MARFEKMGDLFEPVLTLKQKLPTLKDLSGTAAAEERATRAAQPERIEIAAQAEEDSPPAAARRKAKAKKKTAATKKRRKV